MVERNLAKVEVESSRLFSRSNSKGQHVKMLSFFFDASEPVIAGKIRNIRKFSHNKAR